jgi:hypothetical protein
MDLEFNFGRDIIYAKMPKILFDPSPLLKQHVWGVLVPQSDLRLNNTIIQNVLRILL